jgi:outer membrane receptor protein involved in Fe transport
VTFFVDNKLGGNHQFKVGGEAQKETGRDDLEVVLRRQRRAASSTTASANQVRLGHPTDSAQRATQLGLYLNDTYTVRKLTLNVGLRYDRYTPYLPEQDRPSGGLVYGR